MHNRKYQDHSLFQKFQYIAEYYFVLFLRYIYTFRYNIRELRASRAKCIVISIGLMEIFIGTLYIFSVILLQKPLQQVIVVIIYMCSVKDDEY